MPNNILNIERIKFTFLIAIMAVLSSCSSIDNLHYISKKDLPEDPIYQKQEYAIKNKSDYGAIKFTNNNDDEDASLFILHKRSKLYQAETMFSESKDKKMFFSIGFDRREEAPMIGFRMEF